MSVPELGRTQINTDEAIEDGGLGVAVRFTVPIHDSTSLGELREAIRMRSGLGLAVLQAESDASRLGFRPPPDRVMHAGRLLRQIGLLHLYEGRHREAAASFRRALELTRPRDIPEPDRARAMALLGIAALGRDAGGDDALSPGPPGGPPSSPDDRRAGPREAIRIFTDYLAEWPDDLRVRWLLNEAYRQAGKYPHGVPNELLIPLDPADSRLDVGRFEDVARGAGLIVRGPRPAGGSLFDDFDGDGRPDLLTTSLEAERGASLFINRGGGTFEDHSVGTGLEDQVYALNATHADIDNDGDLDVLLLRGGWEGPMRLSLLENRGDGRFRDRTIPGGLGEPIATGAAAWGDYDDDGWVDLFVCGEYGPYGEDPESSSPDPRNRCRLYRNRGDGTFIDVAAAAGVVNERRAKGAAWIDYDGDGRQDLYVSNRDGYGRLYRNRGDGTFIDVAPALGLTGRGADSGSACWAWDYDNDGRPDLFVSDDRIGAAEAASAALGRPIEVSGGPRLYRNQGADGFLEVTREVGLALAVPAMGCNCGDIDEDGFLDIVVGTGWRSSFASLLPIRMFKNLDGRRFEDVTTSTGAGHRRKGQTVSFADVDGDGDLDLYVGSGGAVPGDRADGLLLRNPGHGRHWLRVRLIGTRTNRAAIGAGLRVELKSADGSTRSIHRTIGAGSNFGGNGLVESIGLMDATRVGAVSVYWPASRTTQTIRDLDADQAIEITEGTAGYRRAAVTPDPPARRSP